MVAMDEIPKAQKPAGLATVMAIGTTTPPNCVPQSTYPDYYFRVTNSEHMTELKKKFKRIYEGSTVKHRYMHLTEKILRENPYMCAYLVPSLNVRHDIVCEELPKLAKDVASKAIEEWGQPKSKITHLIVCTIIKSKVAPS